MNVGTTFIITQDEPRPSPGGGRRQPIMGVCVGGMAVYAEVQELVCRCMEAHGSVCMRSGEAHAGWGAAPPGGETHATPVWNSQSPRWGAGTLGGRPPLPMLGEGHGPSPECVWEQSSPGIAGLVQPPPGGQDTSSEVHPHL